MPCHAEVIGYIYLLSYSKQCLFESLLRESYVSDLGVFHCKDFEICKPVCNSLSNNHAYSNLHKLPTKIIKSPQIVLFTFSLTVHFSCDRYQLVGVTLWSGAHYTCMFRYKDNWKFYDGFKAHLEDRDLPPENSTPSFSLYIQTETNSLMLN